MSNFRLYSDGASRGNPGPSGIGVIIKDKEGNVLKKISQYIGSGTNNVAEYTALIVGLEEASRLGIKKLEVLSDSELLVKQIKGVYKVKSEHLKPLFFLVKYIANNFSSIVYKHILRDKNTEADKLATEAVKQDLFKSRQVG